MSNRAFLVTVRTIGCPTRYTVHAESSADAFSQAADRFANVPCGITVMPASV